MAQKTDGSPGSVIKGRNEGVTQMISSECYLKRVWIRGRVGIGTKHILSCSHREILYGVPWIPTPIRFIFLRTGDSLVIYAVPQINGGNGEIWRAVATKLWCEKYAILTNMEGWTDQPRAGLADIASLMFQERHGENNRNGFAWINRILLGEF